MAGLLAAGVLLGLARLDAREARADELRATLGQPLYEVSHSVDVRIAGGVAIYTVRRTFHNSGTIHDEASIDISLPHGAAATGLRIRSRDRWYDGELMEREKAARLYEQLTGLGPHTPRDPALLEWVWPDVLELFVFPVAPGGTSTVEYTLTAPTRFRDGRYVVTYPRPAASDKLAPVVVRVMDEIGDASRVVRVDGKRGTVDAPFVLGPATPPEWLREGSPDASAGWAASRLEVADDGEPEKATVALEITHTYRNDLQVELVTPAGVRVLVRGTEGGSGSDVKGSFTVALPKGTKTRGTWWLVVSDHAGRDVGTLDRWTLGLEGKKGKKTETLAARDVPVFVPDAPEGDDDGSFAIIEVAPAKIDVVAARLARIVLAPPPKDPKDARKTGAPGAVAVADADEGAAAGGPAPGRSFVRLEIDAAPMLRPLPRNLSVVFVVDASHSVGPMLIDAQLEVARAFLSHVPDARFEVVVFRRFAERLTGAFRPAAEIDAAIAEWRAAGRLAPGNGSALDEGLRAAATALAGPKGAKGTKGAGAAKGPAMIVSFTDAFLRTTYENSIALRALGAAPSGTVVHTVLPGLARHDGGEVSESRDDEHWLAPIPASRGGVLLHMEGLPGKPSSLRELALGLVRPVRIDGFTISGVADIDELESVPDALYEGTGYRSMSTTAKPPASVKLSGKIWAAPFLRTVSVSAEFTKATAAFVFSEDRYDGLSTAEMMKLAFLGRAVSPVTSYLAIEPGVRPSKVGIERGRGGLGAHRSVVPMVMAGAATVRAKPDLPKLVKDAVKACVARHSPAAGWKVALRVETTFREVVDVIAVEGGTTPVGACIVEAVWAVRLDTEFTDGHGVHPITFP